MDENTQPAESILYESEDNIQPAESIAFEDVHPDAELLATAGLWLHHYQLMMAEVKPVDDSPKLRRWQSTDSKLSTMRPKTMAGVLMLAIIAKTYAQVPGKREYAHASAPMAWTIVNSLLRLAA